MLVLFVLVYLIISIGLGLFAPAWPRGRSFFRVRYRSMLHRRGKCLYKTHEEQA